MNRPLATFVGRVSGTGWRASADRPLKMTVTELKSAHDLLFHLLPSKPVGEAVSSSPPRPDFAPCGSSLPPSSHGFPYDQDEPQSFTPPQRSPLVIQPLGEKFGRVCRNIFDPEPHITDTTDTGEQATMVPVKADFQSANMEYQPRCHEFQTSQQHLPSQVEQATPQVELTSRVSPGPLVNPFPQRQRREDCGAYLMRVLANLVDAGLFQWEMAYECVIATQAILFRACAAVEIIASAVGATDDDKRRAAMEEARTWRRSLYLEHIMGMSSLNTSQVHPVSTSQVTMHDDAQEDVQFAFDNAHLGCVGYQRSLGTVDNNQYMAYPLPAVLTEGSNEQQLVREPQQQTPVSDELSGSTLSYTPAVAVPNVIYAESMQSLANTAENLCSSSTSTIEEHSGGCKRAIVLNAGAPYHPAAARNSDHFEGSAKRCLVERTDSTHSFAIQQQGAAPSIIPSMQNHLNTTHHQSSSTNLMNVQLEHVPARVTPRKRKHQAKDSSDSKWSFLVGRRFIKPCSSGPYSELYLGEIVDASFTGFAIPDPETAPRGTYDENHNLLVRPPRFPPSHGRERYQVLCKFIATEHEPAMYFTSEGDKASKWRFLEIDVADDAIKEAAA